MMTLEEYFIKGLKRVDPYPLVDHHVRVIDHEDGTISFYLHPVAADGDTLDFFVNGNTLTPVFLGANPCQSSEPSSSYFGA